jgi:hypothetical protein
MLGEYLPFITHLLGHHTEMMSTSNKELMISITCFLERGKKKNSTGKHSLQWEPNTKSRPRQET